MHKWQKYTIYRLVVKLKNKQLLVANIVVLVVEEPVGSVAARVQSQLGFLCTTQ